MLLGFTVYLIRRGNREQGTGSRGKSFLVVIYYKITCKTT
jgi:hypothetical protein